MIDLERIESIGGSYLHLSAKDPKRSLYLTDDEVGELVPKLRVLFPHHFAPDASNRDADALNGRGSLSRHGGNDTA
jgi:hypothetical protein